MFSEHGKTQIIRVADVLFIGPLMTYVAVKAKNTPTWARAALALCGVATVIFNGINFIRIDAQEAERRDQLQP